MDDDLQLLIRNLHQLFAEAMAKSAEETDNGVKVTYEVKGEEQTIDADYVLVTVGRRPNTDELGRLFLSYLF